MALKLGNELRQNQHCSEILSTLRTKYPYKVPFDSVVHSPGCMSLRLPNVSNIKYRTINTFVFSDKSEFETLRQDPQFKFIDEKDQNFRNRSVKNVKRSHF